MLKKGFDCAQNLLGIHLNPTEESLMPYESKRRSGLMGVGSMIPGLRRTACVLGISLSLLMVMVGCGGGSSKTTPPAVAVSITTPTSAQTVPVNGTLAITAAVTNTTNTAVTWTVNGVTNGNSAYGTIAGSGLSVTYNAPPTVPGTATFNITATSQADTTKSASVSVTISAGVAVSMTTPTGPQNLLVSSTLGFTASVTGTSNTGVTWTVNGIANGNATYGTISGSGLTVTYDAPAAVPSPATFNVTATSVADTTKSASVSVTILPVVVVSITTPTGAQSLAVNATLGITASVTGTSNTGVTWTVNGITNGNAAFGTIAGSGLSVTYDAPAAVPSPATFNVTATSVVDTTKSASVSVTITAAAAVAVSITSPTSLTQSVVVNGTLAITAAVANTSNTAVTWTVNGITNGNATYGTIAGSGLSVTYDAPAAVPSPATFNVTATSVADTTKSASVSVTILPVVVVSITTPTGAQSLAVNATLGITASVTGTSNTGVTWTVNGIANGNATYGTVTGTGLTVTYTAPAAVPSPATFNVTATSVVDTTKSASVSVTITAAAAVAVSITSPTNLTQSVVVNGTLAITAAVANTSNTAVTWTVNGITNGNATYGTISGSGSSVTYDAPAAVPSPATFNVTATSVADNTKSASVSVTIVATGACTDTGSESLLSGQYAFILSGYTSSGYLAAVGSFTADGTGKITAGVVDSNGTLVQSAASIDPTQSSYSVGSNHLGCATIVTSSGTFTTRLSVGGITSNVATAGRLVEWDSASSATYLTATGQILKQTVPANVPSGSYVYQLTGVYGSSNQYRTGVVGMITTEAGTSGGTVTGGEYDVNVEGVINDGNGLSTPYSGGTGTYTAPDPTTGRFTVAITGNSVGYLVSGSQFLEMSTDALASDTAVLVGMGQLQSGSLSLTTGSNLVYYVTGTESAELGLINVTGSTSYTANYYEDVSGSPETPQNPQCSYAIDGNGRLVTSGATCTMYLTTYKTMYPPVFYLTGPNTGVMLGTGAGVYVGQVEPQVAPSGGFSSTSLSGTFYDGDSEVVNESVSAEMIDVEVLTFNGSGGVDIIGDYIGGYIGTSVNQEADQTTDTSLGTVNSNGTFSTDSTYGQINAIMISTTKVVDIDNSTSVYPIITVVKQ
jgi:hypothetical protein